MIIAVSDVHLGCKTSNRESFLRFLEKCDTPAIDHLVLLGDILDFWRRNNSAVIMENEAILEKLASLRAKNVHYIVGNHDYLIMRISKRYEEIILCPSPGHCGWRMAAIHSILSMAMS